MKRARPSSEPSTSEPKPPPKEEETRPKEKIPKRDSILENGKIYFTPIGGITVPRQESEGSLSLDEILSDIRPVSSIHMTFMCDFKFLIDSYPPSLRNTPITIVVGQNDVSDMKNETKSHKNVTILGAPLPIPFGTHHSKLSILESENGDIHVIVGTANLVSDDWEFKAQQFYYAKGEKKKEVKDAERCPFQNDLVEYLSYYRAPLNPWRELIKSTTFSTADRLIFSTPGYHTGSQKAILGHPRLFKILSENFPFDPNYEHTERGTFVAQCSSIGSLGPTPNSWYRGQFLKSLEAANPPPANKPSKLFLVFPCVEDVRNSCQGYMGGGSVPYRDSVHKRQTWIQSHMCKWRANKNRRTLAVPHCKTYLKYEKGVPQWQLVTSANVSKAAWGEVSFNKSKNVEQLMIRSWEIGVLICNPSSINIPFDYPLAAYSPTDKPFTTDTLHDVPDHNGCIWTPP